MSEFGTLMLRHLAKMHWLMAYWRLTVAERWPSPV
jgi:hypothetical protein